MKRTNTQKGITLVALIITIVVLLILAVVAIGAVQESNILGYARNAATRFNQAKEDELEKLLEYEELMKEPAGHKVYGTEEFYVIISPENNIMVVQDSKTQVNTKMIKKDKEEYLDGLSSTEANNLRADIEKMEAKCGASAEYLIFIEGMNDGFPIGGEVGNKLCLGSDILELNAELAKKVIRKKGTYQCFGYVDGDGNGILWDVNYNDNTCTMIWDYSSSGILKRFKYDKNTITQNTEPLTVYVEEEPVTIGTEAKKVETQMEGESEILVYYIKDSKLYTDMDQSSLTDGERAIEFPVVEYDLSKLGIVVE